jgi:hypothetical protein
VTAHHKPGSVSCNDVRLKGTGSGWIGIGGDGGWTGVGFVED